MRHAPVGGRDALSTRAPRTPDAARLVSRGRAQGDGLCCGGDRAAGTVAALFPGSERALRSGFAGLLLCEAGLQPDVEVLVNGRNVEFLAGLDTPLTPTDGVTIFYSGVRGPPGDRTRGR